MKIQSLQVKFSNKKGNKCAKFSAYIGAENSSFTQSGTFRSDYEFKQFDSKSKFVSAIEKVLSNPNAVIERVIIDGVTAGSLRDNEIVLLKMSLDSINNQ